MPLLGGGGRCALLLPVGSVRIRVRRFRPSCLRGYSAAATGGGAAAGAAVDAVSAACRGSQYLKRGKPITSGSRAAAARRGMVSSATAPSPALKANELLAVHPAVRDALERCRPVVALESTIVAHGMPYPENSQLCNDVCRILRSRGVEPATVALRGGKCRVGLTPDEVEDLAKSGKDGGAVKCTTRDVPLVLAAMNRGKGGREDQNSAAASPPPPRWGATTVASTMVLAHAAGISTFVTGGIGGVHRGGENSMDVSADLLEMARTPVVVVSAGIKSILDIQRTLEVLETHGVPVVAYGTDEMPAFFSPRSGVPAPRRVDTAGEVADAYWSARDLGLNHGMLVAVPNTDPAGDSVEAAIHDALVEAETMDLHGPAVTPFVLKRVAETTGGDSLRSNMALVRRNAEVGAEIAVAIAEERERRHREGIERNRTVFGGSRSATAVNDVGSDIVVLGGVVLDVVAKPESELLLRTSNPSVVRESDGGVARNIAEVLGRLGHKPTLYSAVGDDSRGRTLLRTLRDECHIRADETTIRTVEGANTATYVAVLDPSGDLHTACADMSVLKKIEPPPAEVLRSARALVMDANPPVDVLRQAALRASEIGIPVFLDPTSTPKARLVAQDTELVSCLTCAFPNADELEVMARGLVDDEEAKNSVQISTLEEQASLVLARMNCKRSGREAQLVVTLGEKGVMLATKDTLGTVSIENFPVENLKTRVQNATGAGDSLCGAYIHAVVGNGVAPAEAIRLGMRAASLSLSSDRAISEKLSPSLK